MRRLSHPTVLALALLLALLLPASAPAQTVEVEKFTLRNGMTVILYPDHTLPIASINIWYRVGSKDELPHRGGRELLDELLVAPE